MSRVMGSKGIMFVVAAIALVAFSAACGAPAPAPTATPSKGVATPAAEATPTPKPAEGGAAVSGDFHGIPLPAGARQAQTFAWTAWTAPGGPEEGEYAEMEWRGYMTSLSADQLISFYKSEMPKRGWGQSWWMEGMAGEGGMAWGIYTRDNEKEAAWIYVVPGEEDFDLVLMWAGKK